MQSPAGSNQLRFFTPHACSPLAAGLLPEVDLTPLMFAVLGATTLLKLCLWAYCYTLRQHSGAALALAEDHANDVLSNCGGCACLGWVGSRWACLQPLR